MTTLAEGSPLTTDFDLTTEETIVLNPGALERPYLREEMRKVSTRNRRSKAFRESVCGYSVLRPDAPNVSPGTYIIRVWTWQEGHDNEHRGAPMQGVKPRSIMAGRKSERA